MAPTALAPHRDSLRAIYDLDGMWHLAYLLDKRTFADARDLTDQLIGYMVSQARIATGPLREEIADATDADLAEIFAGMLGDTLYHEVELAWREQVGPLAGCAMFDDMVRDLAAL